MVCTKSVCMCVKKRSQSHCFCGYMTHIFASMRTSRIYSHHRESKEKRGSEWKKERKRKRKRDRRRAREHVGQ